MAELKPCPKCGIINRQIKIHILSRRLPFRWYIKCANCQYCGAKKLFLRSAIKAWNKEAEKGGDE